MREQRRDRRLAAGLRGSPGRITLGTGRYLGATGHVLSTYEAAHDDIDVVAHVAAIEHIGRNRALLGMRRINVLQSAVTFGVKSRSHVALEVILASRSFALEHGTRR